MISTSPPRPRPHPHCVLTLLGSHERGFVNRFKGILSPAPRTVAVISFEMKLKVSLCYMSWVQHYFNTNTTVRAFFRLRKKPNNLLCAPFSGKVLCRAFFQESSPPEARVSPINQNLKKSAHSLMKNIARWRLFFVKSIAISNKIRYNNLNKTRIGQNMPIGSGGNLL